jgi:hypothetical protein
VKSAILGSLFIGVVSTLGDYMWAEVLRRPHPAWHGVVHGVILFLCIGLVLGSHSGKRRLGSLGSAAIGAAMSIAFYALAPLMGYYSMFPLWFLFWIALGALNLKLSGTMDLKSAAKRGLLAAALSGLAFYLISGIWFPFNPRGWDYLVHFASWTFAYFPGFAALLWQPPRVNARDAVHITTG